MYKVHGPLSTKIILIFYFPLSFLLNADSVSVLKKQDSVLSDDSLLEIKKSHYELLTGKIKKMKSKIIGLRKELSEAKEVKSQLEHQILEWQQEFYSLRYRASWF